MNNVTASPHKGGLGTSIEKQGAGDFPSWQGRGLATARGQTIWWKTDPYSPFLFFTHTSPLFSLKFILLVSSKSLPCHSVRLLGWGILSFILTCWGVLLWAQAALCPFSWFRFIPGSSFFFLIYLYQYYWIAQFAFGLAYWECQVRIKWNCG